MNTCSDLLDQNFLVVGTKDLNSKNTPRDPGQLLLPAGETGPHKASPIIL